ncbi:hypothetical protein BOTNAR_0145g00220 [Botryotinia narcissicola]|uniref:Uncharacterized protein n=1 Tax=Botryotinia narcissicola TaxID=278944 RepID=A0A4Z1IGM1_9HELO|nr:hypothetical protein BOTNAR_0145g00220 [Botryotinia narcissicola]
MSVQSHTNFIERKCHFGISLVTDIGGYAIEVTLQTEEGAQGGARYTEAHVLVERAHPRQ